MANSKTSGATNKAYATVDTLPGAAGYFTEEVTPRDLLKSLKVHKIFFSIREAVADISEAPSALSIITVRLQFKCDGDLDWTDFVPLDGSELAIGNRLTIEDMGNNIKWRAGVTDVDYTSGSVVFGFDW